MSRPKGSKNKPKKVKQLVPIIPPKLDEGYTISIKSLGKTYESKGKTLDEAINNLGLKYMRTVSVWTVKHNGQEKIKILSPKLTGRIFSTYGLTHELAMRQFMNITGLDAA